MPQEEMSWWKEVRKQDQECLLFESEYLRSQAEFTRYQAKELREKSKDNRDYARSLIEEYHGSA